MLLLSSYFIMLWIRFYILKKFLKVYFRLQSALQQLTVSLVLKIFLYPLTGNNCHFMVTL